MRYVKDNNQEHMYKLSIEGTGVPMDELPQEVVHDLVYAVKKKVKAEPVAMASSIMEETIDGLGLPTRVVNALYEANIVLVKELLGKTESEISRLHYIGKNTMEAVKVCLAEKGLQLKKE